MVGEGSRAQAGGEGTSKISVARFRGLGYCERYR
jgi:hypothetical protein